MFKFLVLGVFLSQQVVKDVYGQPQAEVYDTVPTVLSPLLPALNNDSKKELTQKTDGKYNFYARHQTFYLSAFPWKYSKGFTANLGEDGKELDAGYNVTQGIGAHKLHLHRMTWNMARRYCIEEGGHLAIIRSDEEERILQQMLTNSSAANAWVGYHDGFEENEWITVLDEPISQAGWAGWSKSLEVNPDNYQGNQNCGLFVSAGGMIDWNCGNLKPFFCKISIL